MCEGAGGAGGKGMETIKEAAGEDGMLSADELKTLEDQEGITPDMISKIQEMISAGGDAAGININELGGLFEDAEAVEKAA